MKKEMGNAVGPIKKKCEKYEIETKEPRNIILALVAFSNYDLVQY